MALSHQLPPLSAAGARIIDRSTGVPVLLRGINRSGMEYRGPHGEQWTESEFDRLAIDWGANIIRLPFNQDWATAREGYDPAPYLASLDCAIAMAAQRGAHTLLALQWLDDHTVRGYDNQGRPNFVPPLPDLGSMALWSQLGARYREEPAVLYDILSEPHPALPGDEIPVNGAAWQPWARALIQAVRGANPEALIFVSGENWGYDLGGYPIPGIEGVVYSTHIYPAKGHNWDRAFGDLARAACVMAAEWGGGDADIAWGAELAAYLAERQIGWAAWGWPDHPPLIRSDYSATPFGALVRSRLKG